MFSFLCYRATESGKRNSEDDLEDPPPGKVAKLDLFEDENSISLPEQLADLTNMYIRKHVTDKVLKEKILDENPVPENVDQPLKLDMFIKDIISNHKSVIVTRNTQL